MPDVKDLANFLFAYILNSTYYKSSYPYYQG
jgi:hypothetical protein